MNDKPKSLLRDVIRHHELPIQTCGDSPLVVLRKITMTPVMPFPDPGAHSERAFADAVFSAWQRIQVMARAAIAKSDAAEQHGVETITRLRADLQLAAETLQSHQQAHLRAGALCDAAGIVNDERGRARDFGELAARFEQTLKETM